MGESELLIYPIKLSLFYGTLFLFTHVLTQRETNKKNIYEFASKIRSAMFGLICAITTGLVTLVTISYGYRSGLITYLRTVKHINFQYLFDGILLLVVLLLLFIEKENLRSISLTCYKLKSALIKGILISIVFLVMGITIKIAFSTHIYNTTQLAFVLKGILKQNFVGYNLIPTFMVVGFTEELVYRGYIQTRLTYWIGNVPGIILTSLFFSLNHLPVWMVTLNTTFRDAFIGCIQALPISIALGYIFVRTRNIVVPSIVHIIIDIINIYI
jgi:membrane protease YdiL (CAAX protease family)